MKVHKCHLEYNSLTESVGKDNTKYETNEPVNNVSLPIFAP